MQGPSLPLHPAPPDNTFMGCLGSNECVQRDDGGEALQGRLGTFGTLHVLQMAFFACRLGGGLP